MSMFQDMRYALRQLRKNPGFAAVAILTLALGIGANTGIFTLVNAVMLKSLPVPHPEQVYLVNEGNFAPQNTRFAYRTFQNGRAAMPQGVDLAAASWPGRFYAAFGGGDPEMSTGQLVSGNYFETTGTYAEKGRLLGENDDREVVGSQVAVISYESWERHFGRDPNVVGSKLTVNGMPLQIVGVAARGFFGMQLGAAPEFWMPTTLQSAVRYRQHYSQDANAKTDQPWVLQADIRWLQFTVRASNPKLVAQASAALNQVFHAELQQAAAQEKDPTERERMLRAHLMLTPGARGLPTLRNHFSQPLLALMAMVGIILLIACANLANLFLARAAGREREMAVRLSIGATRTRLVRQLLVECVLLSLVGTVVGSAIAYWLSAKLPLWASGRGAPILLSLAPDARVLLFSVVVAVLTGIAFGLAPALRGSHVEPIHALKSGGRSAYAAGSPWSLKQTLVSMQVALSLVLLVGAGLFVRTLRNFSIFDPGFDRDHLLTVSLDTHLAGYQPVQLTPLYHTLIERVEAIPGVRSASLVSCDLASGCQDASDIFLAAVPHTGEIDSQERFVSPEFFTTAGIPLIQGRTFADSDRETAPKVVVVNETFVRQFLPGKDPIGQYYGYEAANPRQFEIVGVIKDSRVNDVREDVPPMSFHSLTQDAVDVESLNVRTFGDPAQLVPEIRQVVKSVDPKLPIASSTTLAQVVSNGLWSYRLIARLASIFGVLALALACLGLYGVMSYTVARRTAEFGIRMALGASRTGLLSLILNNVLLVIGSGVMVGLALSFASVRAVKSMLFGLSPYDPLTIIAAVLTLTGVAVIAGLRPAWRAAHVDPMEALRVE